MGFTYFEGHSLPAITRTRQDGTSYTLKIGVDQHGAPTEMGRILLWACYGLGYCVMCTELKPVEDFEQERYLGANDGPQTDVCVCKACLRSLED